MASTDVSRFLHQPQKHYAGVRLEQSSALLDSDFNEGARAGESDLAGSLNDVIGPVGSPDAGFSVGGELVEPVSPPILPGVQLPLQQELINGVETAFYREVSLRAGTLYLGGRRFELPQAEAIERQSGFLQMRPGDFPDDSAQNTEFTHLYYVRAWEQLVSAVEDPELREAMLRGPDTSMRLRRMQRVQIADVASQEPEDCHAAWDAVVSQLQSDFNSTFDPATYELRSNGRLQLRFPGGDSADSCAPSDPQGRRYLGAENQTLRIMLTASDRFVWALQTSTPLFKVEILGLDEPESGVRIRILNPPQEEENWPYFHRVIEILPFAAAIDGAPPNGEVEPHYGRIAAQVGIFSRAADRYDPVTHSFAIDIANVPGVVEALQALVHQWPSGHPANRWNGASGTPGARNFYMRLWHHAGAASEVELPADSPPVLAGIGVQPSFTNGRRGDYWLAALRPNAPQSVVPFDLLQEGGVAPHGPREFFAPLALLRGEANTVTAFEDCRPRIVPLNQRGCIALTVGPCGTADFTSVQSAIDALPPEGGTISVRPGVYRELITIANRKNVTIEGCGPATRLEMPAEASRTAVIEVQWGASQTVIRSLAIRTLARGAVWAVGCDDIRLEELEVESGEYQVNGEFQQGRGSSTSALISFAELAGGVIDHVIVRPARQPGISLGLVGLTTISHLDAKSTHGTLLAQTGPMVAVGVYSNRVTVRDSRMVLYGQVGVYVGSSSTTRLSELQLTSGAQIFKGNPFTNTKPCIDIDSPDAQDVQLTRCRLMFNTDRSDEAVVSVQGQGVRVEDNDVRVQSRAGVPRYLAWGGIHVRGNSASVALRHNRIRGGYGHGITLGSVGWGTAAGEPTTRREGPGTRQTENQSGYLVATGYVATWNADNQNWTSQDEGVISDLHIVDNDIRDMGSNGISALTIMGLNGADLLQMDRVFIERNTIIDNLQSLDRDPNENSVLRFPTSRHGYFIDLLTIPCGGVVLPLVGSGAIIRENTIVDNAQGSLPGATNPQLVPINGIFVLAGDGVVIENNRIANNGKPAHPSNPGQSGVRAGIAVMLAGTPTSTQNSLELYTPSYPDYLQMDHGGVALRVVNNTVQQPEGRALHAVATGPVTVSGNFLTSNGFHGATRAEEYAIGDIVYLQNLGAPWEAHLFDEIAPSQIANVGDPPYHVPGYYQPEHDFQVFYHRDPNARRHSPRLDLGIGGAIGFSNNQVVYDWHVVRLPRYGGAPLSYFPTAIIALDHVTLNGNQFATSIDGIVTTDLPPPNSQVSEPVLSDVLAMGVTLNVQLNRFSETIGSCAFSFLSRADIMSTVSLNQSTHRLVCQMTQRGSYTMEDSQGRLIYDRDMTEHNLVLLTPISLEDDGSRMESIRSQLAYFFVLAEDPNRS